MVMKVLQVLIVSVLIFSIQVKSQNLTEKYKKGAIELIPDENYGKNNDWNTIFRSYYDSLMHKAVGKRKSLIVLNDGSVIISNSYQDYYTKFDVDGNFEKEFNVVKNGKKIKKLKHIKGQIQNLLYTGADNMGNVLFFDFDGNYKKKLTLNYSVNKIITLSNSELAVSGWSIWSDKFRYFVSVVDFNTNKEKIIWDSFIKRKSTGNKMYFIYTYHFGNKKTKFNNLNEFNNYNKNIIKISTMPFSTINHFAKIPIINRVKDKLVVAVPKNGEIMIFDKSGKMLSKSKINWAKNYISVEEQKKIQKKAIEKYKSIKNPNFASWVSPEENKKALNTIIKQMEEDLKNIKEPLEIPVFSTVIKDSDDNLLFFEFAKKDYQNSFNVWILKNNGEFVAKSSFVCKDYYLEIKPGKMVFYKGYIYALVEKKNVKGNPLRLVRFRLKVKN